jgi:hypothetical protein
MEPNIYGELIQTMKVASKLDGLVIEGEYCEVRTPGYLELLSYESKLREIESLWDGSHTLDVLAKPQPASYIKWALSKGIEISWLEWARKHGLPVTLAEPERIETKQPTQEKPLLTRERETALKLIIGMAIAGYRYDPDAARSEVTGDISRDLQKLGISLDQDTVRKWLREAAELLPTKPEKT